VGIEVWLAIIYAAIVLGYFVVVGVFEIISWLTGARSDTPPSLWPL